MVDGRGDGRGNSSKSDLAHAACAVFVQRKVGIVEESDIDLRRVGAGGDDVVREVAIDGMAISRVV